MCTWFVDFYEGFGEIVRWRLGSGHTRSSGHAANWVTSSSVVFRRESPLRGRRLRFDEALLERFAMTSIGRQFGMHVSPLIDKVMIPRTKGRVSSAGIDKVGLVTSTGAKSGQSRTHPLVLIDDADGLLAIASNYGREKHPAWSANLVAHPECEVEFRGPPARYRAELLTGRPRIGMGHGRRLLCRL